MRRVNRDCLQIILEYLDSSMLPCCRVVNSTWAEVVASLIVYLNGKDETSFIWHLFHELAAKAGNATGRLITRFALVTLASAAAFTERACPNKKLQILNISGLNVNDSGLILLANFENLHTLDMSFCVRVTDNGLGQLKLAKLLRFSISGCREVTSLSSLANCPHLQELYIRKCQVTDASLAQLEHCPNLQRLDVSECTNLTDKALAHLAKCPALLHLVMSGIDVTDEGLAQLKHCPNLQHLEVSHCTNLTDKALAHLAKPALLHLIVQNCRVADEGFAHLAHCPNLQHLDLSRCNLTDQALQCLPKCPALVHLVLSSNQVTDEGLKHVRRFKNLQHLDLSDCTAVTLAGLESLQRLVDLQHLDISYCNVTYKDLEQLTDFEPRTLADNMFRSSVRGLPSPETTTVRACVLQKKKRS